MLVRSTFVITCAALLLGCASRDASPPDSLDRIFYHGSPAVRLSNGTAEVIIAPSSSGRIVRYGLIGAENLLRESDALAGATPSTRAYDGAPFHVERIDALAVRLT